MMVPSWVQAAATAIKVPPMVHDYAILHEEAAVVVQNSIFCGIEVQGEINIATTASASTWGSSTFLGTAAQTRNSYATTYGKPQ